MDSVKDLDVIIKDAAISFSKSLAKLHTLYEVNTLPNQATKLRDELYSEGMEYGGIIYPECIALVKAVKKMMIHLQEETALSVQYRTAILLTTAECARLKLQVERMRGIHSNELSKLEAIAMSIRHESHILSIETKRARREASTREMRGVAFNVGCVGVLLLGFLRGYFITPLLIAIAMALFGNSSKGSSQEIQELAEELEELKAKISKVDEAGAAMKNAIKFVDSFLAQFIVGLTDFEERGDYAYESDLWEPEVENGKLGKKKRFQNNQVVESEKVTQYRWLVLGVDADRVIHSCDQFLANARSNDQFLVHLQEGPNQRPAKQVQAIEL